VEIRIESIEDIHNLIKDEIIEPELLQVTVDSDKTYFYYNDELVFTGGGYKDIDEVLTLLFPESEVGWM